MIFNYLLIRLIKKINLEKKKRKETKQSIIHSWTIRSSQYPRLGTCLNKCSCPTRKGSRPYIRLESMNQDSTNQESMFESISKSKRTRKKMNSFSTNFVSMNTRSRARKSIYAITLIIVNYLISYYTTFSIELQRSNQSSISKLYRNDLSFESRY